MRKEFLVIFIVFWNEIIAQRPQQQWYLTGKNFNDERNFTKYQSEIINLWSISSHHGTDEKAINYTHSSFGGAIAVFVGHNTTLDVAIEKLIREVLRPHFHTQYELHVSDIWHYDLFVSVNQEAPLQYEIGLYDLGSGKWLKYGIHQVKLGKEWRIICNISISTEESETYSELHRFVVTSDLYQTLTMAQHTWETISNRATDPIVEPTPGLSKSFNLRVMTYNIWHNNPPLWLLHDNNKRWNWYQKRMRHLAKMIQTQNPDIIALQEVRLDNGFPPKTANPNQLSQYGYEFNFKDDPEILKSALFSNPTGSQLHHMLRYLHQTFMTLEESKQLNQTEQCTLLPDSVSVCETDTQLDKDQKTILNKIFDKYQFVYQPAMSMYERENMGKRVEEGLAILVKNNFQSQANPNASSYSLHVSKAQTLFLPRNFEDPSDDHHRAVLHLEVQLLNKNSSNDVPLKVDIMTTHMRYSKSVKSLTHNHSLSSSARDDSVKAIWNYTKSECRGDIQILTGDFNAEPHENTYGCLTGRCSQDSWKSSFTDTDCPCNSESGPYIDSWLHSIRELRAQRNGGIEDGTNKYTEVEREGYTYPPCNPEKRIDFILVRNQTKGQNIGWKGNIMSSWLVGKEVTPETAHMLTQREGLGMLDKDSPIWASDHYAVVSDIQLDYQL